MKNISLDITKAAQFLDEGVIAAYEPAVKAAQEALETVLAPEMISSDGFICHQASLRNSSMRCRL